MGWASVSPPVTEGAWSCLWIRCVVRKVWEALDTNLLGSSITIHCTAHPSALACPPPGCPTTHSGHVLGCPTVLTGPCQASLQAWSDKPRQWGQVARTREEERAAKPPFTCFLMRSSEHSFPASVWGNNSGTTNNDQGGCFKVKNSKEYDSPDREGRGSEAHLTRRLKPHPAHFYSRCPQLAWKMK